MNKMDISNMNDTIRPLLFDVMADENYNVPEELLPIVKESGALIHDHSKKIIGMIIRYKELMMMYNCALKEIQTRFEILNAEISIQNRRNPIKFITPRLKSSASIIEKMERQGIPMSIENIENDIDDVAGIRVICSYIDDIYALSKALLSQRDIEVVSTKDYIINPKANGYRSLHMIIKVPIHFENGIKDVKVEVQIRTIAMDFWATLEHELIYKNHLEDEDDIRNELNECAAIMSGADRKMQDLRKRAEELCVESTEENELIEQMKKIDYPL